MVLVSIINTVEKELNCAIRIHSNVSFFVCVTSSTPPLEGHRQLKYFTYSDVYFLCENNFMTYFIDFKIGSKSMCMRVFVYNGEKYSSKLCVSVSS